MTAALPAAHGRRKRHKRLAKRVRRWMAARLVGLAAVVLPRLYVAYMSLVVPGRTGQWLVRGTLTQGDLASWIVSGSYQRQAEATHAYEAGFSYSTQRYLGANTEALQAMSNGSRNAGVMYAYDKIRREVGQDADLSRTLERLTAELTT